MVGYSKLVLSLSIGLFSVSAVRAGTPPDVELPPLVATDSFPDGLDGNTSEGTWTSYLLEVCRQYGPESNELHNACLHAEHSIPNWHLMRLDKFIMWHVLQRYFLETLRKPQLTGNEFSFKSLQEKNVAYSSNNGISAAEDALAIYTREIIDQNGDLIEGKTFREFRRKLRKIQKLFGHNILWCTLPGIIATHYTHSLVANKEGFRSPEFHEKLDRMNSVFGYEIAAEAAVRAISFPGRVTEAKNLLYQNTPTSPEFQQDFDFLKSLLGLHAARRILNNSALKQLRSSRDPVADFNALRNILLQDPNGTDPVARLQFALELVFEDGIKLAIYHAEPQEYDALLALLREQCGEEIATEIEQKARPIWQEREAAQNR
ncbi:MAG: hypothetical protein K2L24_02110 [Opitutales bacterium]|nr:hypothetical protein [Opitutales bacterium]